MNQKDESRSVKLPIRQFFSWSPGFNSMKATLKIPFIIHRHRIIFQLKVRKIIHLGNEVKFNFSVMRRTVNLRPQKINMETLNLIQTICAVLGLFLTIFLTTQVISIKNSIRDNSTNQVEQKKNKVTGDMSGRDVHK